VRAMSKGLGSVGRGEDSAGARALSKGLSSAGRRDADARSLARGLSSARSAGHEGPTFFCSVCFEDHPEAERFVCCRQGHSLCRETARDYVMMSLQTSAEVHCPECKAEQPEGADDREPVAVLVEPGRIVGLLSNSQGDLYRRSRARLAGRLAGNWECPHCWTSVGVGDEWSDVMRFTCPNPKCARDVCLSCRSREWHEGKTCDEFQASVMGPEIAMRRRAGAKHCPTCGPTNAQAWFEKTTDTCNKVVCPICHIKWCWACEEVLENQADPYSHWGGTSGNGQSRCKAKVGLFAN